jgi:two-component system, OmpR family, phosphate regulon sensor histidine kinase PhoR
MSMDENRGTSRGWELLAARLRRARRVLIATAIVFLVFALARALSPLQALIAFLIIAAAALLGANGDAGDAAAVHNDERRASLDAALIDALIAGLPDPAIMLERDGRVVAFNEAARAIAPALTRGQPLSLALRMPEIVEAVREVARTGEPQQVEYSERVPIDRWFAVHVTAIDWAGSRPDGKLKLLVFNDLTPLRRVEELRADFVANASHELRTPLAALSGFIDTLQGPAREDTAARERFLGIMKGQAARMARLIDDLLSLSRVELNEHLHPQTPLDVVPIVRQVVDGLQMLARERGVEISLANGTGPLIVAGDRDELTRVYENLIENALKYAASGKRVDIQVSRTETDDGGEAVVSVRDFGPGIATEHLPRLTERFYRIDVGQSRAEGGTGLGLALVKHILNRHRGRLVIDSVPGEGATFTTLLPLAG